MTYQPSESSNVGTLNTDIKDKRLLSILQTNSSKVVDANGEPMVVYHGTLTNGLTKFSKDFIGSRYSYDEKGFFFISDKNIAQDYSTSEFDANRKGEVIPAFVCLQNPLIVDSKWCKKNGLGSRVFKDNDVIEFWDNYQTLLLEESENNDGVIVTDGKYSMPVAFEPTQIKSATDNTGSFDPANPDIRFMTGPEFTERKITTLEKMENKRAQLLEDRENIANFDEQLSDVDAAIAAYKASDPVAETFDAPESDEHLAAVEDVVYDIQRQEEVEGIQVDVIKSVDALLEYAHSNNWAKEDIEDIKQGIISNGYYGDGYITILSCFIENKKGATGIFWHERTHNVTEEIFTSNQLMQAAEQAGVELLDEALKKRGYSTENYSMKRMADEYISRAVEILAKKGLLNEYLSTHEAGFDSIKQYLAERNVPSLLQNCITNVCQYIKAQKYGIEREDLLRTNNNGGATTPRKQIAPMRSDYRATVEADAGTDAAGDAALRRGISGAKGVSQPTGEQDGVRSDDAVGVHSTRGGDLNASFDDLVAEQKAQIIAAQNKPKQKRLTDKEKIAQLKGTVKDAEREVRSVKKDTEREILSVKKDTEREVSTLKSDLEKGNRTISHAQDLIADLRQRLKDNKTSVRDLATEISKRVRKVVSVDVANAMGKRAFDGIIKQIEAATTKRDIEKPLQRITEIITDVDLKRVQDKVKKLLELKVQDLNARGVSVAKSVDDKTRVLFETFRNNLNRNLEELRGEVESWDLADGIEGHTAIDLISDYQQAQIYQSNIEQLEKDYATLLRENSEMRRKRTEARKAGDTNTDVELRQKIALNNEALAAMDVERVQNKVNMLKQLSHVGDTLAGYIEEGKTVYADWIEQNAERKRNLVATACRDADDGKRHSIFNDEKSLSPYQKTYKKLKRALFAPQYAMNYMLKKVSRNAPKGEGALYNYFMRSENGYVEAANRYYQGYEAYKKTLNDKVKSIFGNKFDYTKLLAQSNEASGIEVKIIDGHESEVMPLTKGEAMYLYMVDKMADGRAQLRRMGISSNDISNIRDTLDAKYIAFADWLQDEFLPEKRKRYNETHLEMFGTQMAEIENYVPLKRYKAATYQEVDGTNKDADLPSTMTGSVIARKRNNVIIDTRTNALDLILEHGQQMEHWNAYIHVTSDMNTVLSSTAFRRRINDIDPNMHEMMKAAAQISVGAYHDTPNEVNKMWVTMSKLAAGSKIAFRVWTATKQITSIPAFFAYSTDPMFWRALANRMAPHSWLSNRKWAMDHIPSLHERWYGRMAGDEKLANVTGTWVDRIVKKKCAQWGMTANAYVDIQACAIGARAVYDYKVKKYKREGLSAEEADRLALIDASIAVNETQQSSNGMYLSKLQSDRDAFSVIVSTFQNSNFSYLRKQMEAVDELCRNVKKEREYLIKQYTRDGMPLKDAGIKASKEVARAKADSIVQLTVFLFLLNIVWSLYGNVWKYTFGPDGDDEDQLPSDLLIASAVSVGRNMVFGSMIEPTIKGLGFSLSLLQSDMDKTFNGLHNSLDGKAKCYDNTALYLTAQTIGNLGLGVDITTFANAYQGIRGMLMDGAQVEDVMQLMNAPKSQTKLIAGVPHEGESAEEYKKRMIFIERRIESRVNKSNLDKWSRNYQAYKDAELLGLKTLRDKFGNVGIPELDETKAAYKEMMSQCGLTTAGNKTKDFKELGLTDSQRELRADIRTKVRRIAKIKKQLDDSIVFNAARRDSINEMLRLQKECVEMWNNKE